MVKEIQSLGEFEREIAGPGLVVVDFFTTWCGPCKKIAPVLEALALKYSDVKFIKVDIEKNEDVAAPRNISSIPTFHFIVKGKLVDELKGADPSAIEQKIAQHKVDVNPFTGSGHRLVDPESTDPHVPALSAREARLKAFASLEGERKQTSSTPTTGTTSVPAAANCEKDDEEEALSKALSLSLADGTSLAPNKKVPAAAPTQTASQRKQEEADYAAVQAEFDAQDSNAAAPEHFKEAPGQTWEEEMVPVPVNEDMLAQLLEMGFPDVRARKSLVHGGSVDGAMAWLADHQDDADIDQPYMVRKIDTLPKPPLSEEEKAARMAAIKEKVQQRKAERAKQEKADEIRKEKERRERGQKIDETLEERQRMQRKRDAEKIKREKDDAAKERLRLRAEIAADKERRRANNGVLPSVLGVDGYNPSIIQYDVPSTVGGYTTAPSEAASVPAKRINETAAAGASSAAAAPASTTSTTVPAKVPPAKKPTTSASSATHSSTSTSTSTATPEQRVDSAIQTIMRYRTGGDGGQALKLLLTFVRNVAQNPTELKYQSISTESAAFKNKLLPLVGPLILLKAVGFQKGEGEDEGKLKFEGDASSSLLADTVEKLTNAEALYRQQNAL
eukprot:CAMPEP_0170387838 /NCGR_PEP_ID=MMETSP0117_2-20130122/17769_1 /TAXON_ID=400756 /ORGANISM="Durinskia baltica, Strain CSIRO CS-38" /LENGTH=616 /DNA_ID=CAMNT_0010643729 /DNA_START=35 /DNA_END=1885 /DNA_ORIENTATION=+